jgi:glycosyltransferase involved in cell wall biosynthesis
MVAIRKKAIVDAMTSQSPTVTVIIPTYNSSGTLKISLESVLRQYFSDFEVWVVGDGCSDDSEAIVASFNDGRVHWMNLPVNSGTPSAPRNEGLRRARGQYIAYLGHDDLWFPWHLSELVDCIERSKTDFVYSMGVLLGPEGIVGTFSLPKRLWHTSEPASPSNWLHRKSLIDTMGLWSLRMRMGDDMDFLRRIFVANAQLGFRRQLSVLKYPANLWHMYSRASHFPQQKHMEAICNDPEAFRLELLLDIAAHMSRHMKLLRQYKGRVSKLVQGLIRFALDMYGRNHWPANSLCYWWWRRKAGLIKYQRKVSNQEAHGKFMS